MGGTRKSGRRPEIYLSVFSVSLCFQLTRSPGLFFETQRHRVTEIGDGKNKGKKRKGDCFLRVLCVSVFPFPPLRFKPIASIPFFLPSALLFREPPAFRSRRRPRRLALDHRPQSGQNQLPQ